MQGLISVLFYNPLLFLLLVLSLLLSVTIHEFAHAYVALKLGDPTAKNLGRVTLNPLAHLDPLGTLSLLFIGLGWGRPVPVDYYNLKRPKRDAALISLAGPGSNFLMAVVLTLIVKITGLFFAGDFLALIKPSTLVTALLYPLILYNVILGVFNLIPIEPLDGFKIVNGILPPRLAVQWVQLAPYGIYILFLLMVTGTFTRIISPAVDLFSRILQLQL